MVKNETLFGIIVIISFDFIVFNSRFWGLVGQEYFGSFLLSQGKCGGLLIWFRSLYSGKCLCYLEDMYFFLIFDRYNTPQQSSP